MEPQKTPESQSKKTRKKSKGIIVFLSIIFITLALAMTALLDQKTPKTVSSNTSNSIFDTMFSSSSETTFPEDDYIARIFISGVIQEAGKNYNQDWLLALIEHLEQDEHNKGIILYIDSPGGTVYESDEAYLAFSHYQSTNKPIWSYVSHMSASGAYYISCGTEYICANRNSLTGSIGVISGQSVDITGLMDQFGIKSRTFTAGRNKNMLNYNSPLTEEQIDIMQSIADEYYEQFTIIVAVNRHLDIDNVRKLADGRIYTAKQALKEKLIDRICSYDECINSMKAKHGLTDVQVADFRYHAAPSVFDIFSLETNLSPSKSAEEKILDMITPSFKYPAYIYQ